MRVNVSHVVSWAAVQFICSLLMGRFSLTEYFLNYYLSTKGIWGWLQLVATTRIEGRGNPWCWALLTDSQKHQWFYSNKHRVSAGQVSVKDKRKRRCSFFSLCFYCTSVFLLVLSHDCCQVNLQSWALSTPFLRHLVAFWSDRLFLNAFRRTLKGSEQGK